MLLFFFFHCFVHLMGAVWRHYYSLWEHYLIKHNIKSQKVFGYIIDSLTPSEEKGRSTASDFGPHEPQDIFSRNNLPNWGILWPLAAIHWELELDHNKGVSLRSDVLSAQRECRKYWFRARKTSESCPVSQCPRRSRVPPPLWRTN